MFIDKFGSFFRLLSSALCNPSDIHSHLSAFSHSAPVCHFVRVTTSVIFASTQIRFPRAAFRLTFVLCSLLHAPSFQVMVRTDPYLPVSAQLFKRPSSPLLSDN